MDLLERHTEYAAPLSSSTQHIAWFWETLRGFSAHNKARLIRFVFGQERLPPTDADWEASGTRMLIKCSARAGGPPPHGAARVGFSGGGLGGGGLTGRRDGPTAAANAAIGFGMGVLRTFVGDSDMMRGRLSQEYVDARLPSSDTCFGNLDLPAYSSRAVLTERLLCSISMDAGLDADTV